ncbi:[LysW]-aminoadipate kinase [Thermanaerovibrio acidaminovorans]|uniref:Aspartate/glutamate/uridylate kinase n=1 Tax=Thermanaerovibrio acidaminovorans (strain ATCC 49978 / DSM 6589 / Su883) TaxID=525903 RepID=D1B8T2_THEAS|nr:[LysW]-aminoadipate kinase [Thermanaerovibrio acidaminovorans]ACZ18685.1 aspartate/glutamate/uridylate kinase [Thermanaerovibrio acidaminovorans DSM 6589]
MLGVVKIGGARGNRYDHLVRELSARVLRGERWILVHGASGRMEELCASRGVEVRIVCSPSGYTSRYVGPVEREIFEEAAFHMSHLVSSMLRSSGVEPAIVTPAEGERKDCLRSVEGGRVRILRDNYSGRVTRVDPQPIRRLLELSKVPVIPPLAMCQGLFINVDGDRLAAQVAAAVGAQGLVILSNVPGLMRDLEDPNSVLPMASLEEWDLVESLAAGNMKRKVLAAREALGAGVQRVILADGRLEEPLAGALEGRGTVLCSAPCTVAAASS